MLLTGVSLVGFVKRLINAFKSRVSLGSGTFESEACLNTQINSIRVLGLYDKASLIVTPNAYKAAKIYALKPTNGSGDLTFSRGSARTRRNASGAIENLASDVPAIDYSLGVCPVMLFEPQRTNLFLNSFAPVTQTITVVNGSTYTVSVGSGSAALSGAGSGAATAGSNVTFVASGTSLTVTISGSPSWVQVELGAFATSPIVTTGTSSTRVGDRIPALVNSALFATGVTWFVHAKNNIAVANGGVHLSGPFIGNGTQGLFIATTTTDRLRLWTQAAGEVYQTAANEVKLAVVCNGTTVDVFANGVKVVTGYSYAFTFDRIGVNIPNIPLFLQGMHLYPSVLSDAECITLTTP